MLQKCRGETQGNTASQPTSGFQSLQFFCGNFDEVVPAFLRALDQIRPTAQLLPVQLQLPDLQPCGGVKSGTDPVFSLPPELLPQQSTTRML